MLAGKNKNQETEFQTSFKSCTLHCTKMKFFIKDFFSKSDRIRRKLRIWSHLLKKSLMENFIFCAVLAFATVLAFAFANLQLNTLDPVVEPPTSTTSFF